MTRVLDWIVPPAALRWGRLTQPPPLEITITVDITRFLAGVRRAGAAAATAQASFDRLADALKADGCSTDDELLERLHADAAEFRDRRNSNWRSTGP